MTIEIFSAFWPIIGRERTSFREGDFVPYVVHQPETHASSLLKERRKYLRIKAAIPVELMPEDAAAVTHAQTADISVGGCYVEMNFTLPVGTRVEMALWLGEEKVWVNAKVVTQHAYFGNGFVFLEVSENLRSKLMRFLNSVST